MFRRLVLLCAWVLAAAWLPAQQHCELEAVGLLSTTHDDEGGCCPATGDCHDDGCELVENMGFAAPAALKLSTPALTVCLALLHVKVDALAAAASPAVQPWDKVAAEDWVPEWAFARRAAHAPRAPSVSGV